MSDGIDHSTDSSTLQTTLATDSFQQMPNNKNWNEWDASSLFSGEQNWQNFVFSNFLNDAIDVKYIYRTKFSLIELINYYWNQ